MITPQLIAKQYVYYKGNGLSVAFFVALNKDSGDYTGSQLLHLT